MEDCALLTEHIAGLDNRDFTTADIAVQDYKKSLTKDIRGKRIGVPTEFFAEGLDEKVRKVVNEAILVLKDNGAVVEEFSLPLAEYSLSAYYIISSAEASSNLSRFDGIRYGHRAKNFDKAFKSFDAIVSPTSPSIAFKFGEKTDDVLSMYLSDIYTVPVNIAGLPAISLPCGFADGLPVGLQFIGNYFREDMLFNLAYSYEQSTQWHKLAPNV